jgi:hypothetical protein
MLKLPVLCLHSPLRSASFRARMMRRFTSSYMDAALSAAAAAAVAILLL